MTNKTLDLELAGFIRSLEKHINNSYLAKVMRSCAGTLERQNRELQHLYDENDDLRRKLATAHQGLLEARDAILKLKGE